MALPKINGVRLQTIVNNLESGRAFRTFDDLCIKVATTNWAEENGLDADDVAALIEHHQIACKTKQAAAGAPPAASPVPAAGPPAPAVSAPAAPAAATPEPPVEPVAPAAAVAATPEPPVEPVAPAATPPALPAEKPEGKKRGRKPKAAVAATTQVEEPQAEVKPAEKPEGKPKAAEPRGRSRVTYGGGVVVGTPAGKVPVPLTDKPRAGVEEWAEAVRQHRLDKDGAFLSLAALKYYARMSCGLSDKEAKEVHGFLDEIYGEE